MVSNSISMLRKYNKSIHVRLHLVHDGGEYTKTTNHQGGSLSINSNYITSDYIKLISDLGVEIVEKDPLTFEGEEGFFHIHRHLFKDAIEDSLLFIDADTFIFGNVEDLFERYKEYDYVGLPIPNLADWDKKWLPFNPYNSAVNLWNNGWITKFAHALPKYCKLIREKEHPCSDWCYSRCSKCTGREEISTSLFINDNNIKHTLWDKWDVRNSSSYIDYDESPYTYIFHTFTHNWSMAKGRFTGRRMKVQLSFVHTPNHNAKYKNRRRTKC